MKEIILKDSLVDLDKSKAEQIEKTFAPMVAMLKSFESELKKVKEMEISPVKCEQAKALRLQIAKVRVEADKARKAQKEQYLRAGNAIQGAFNILKYAIEPEEAELKNIETHYERIETARIEALSLKRGEELSKYGFLELPDNLGNMEEALYNALRDGAIAKFQAARDLEARLEKERIEREEKEVVYNSRLQALLIYGDLFDRSLLTLDSTEAEFEKIIFNTKALKVAFDKKALEQVEENARLKKEADKAEKKRLADEKKRTDEKAIFDKKLKDAQEKVDALERKKAVEIATKLEEEKRKSESSDKEKLVDISTYLASKTDTVKSEKAKDAIRKAYVQITDVIKSL